MAFTVVRLGPGGDIEYRTDPEWFTPYHRRDTVEWEDGMLPLNKAVS